MANTTEDWDIPAEAQPKAADYTFDLDKALSSVLSLTTRVPPDAFTAETLGPERSGNAVLIRDDGILLTIGYLITEADQVWLTTVNGRVVPGYVLGIDQTSGFGLVQALSPLDVPAIPLGTSRSVPIGAQVVVAAGGGRKHAVAAQILARQEFAGYWEYLLDEAIFTAPAHPHWGGAAMIGPAGDLVGIGSLQLQHEMPGGRIVPLNMIVPVELLEPVYNDLLTLGRPDRPPRPWLGLLATEAHGRVVVAGISSKGPAQRAGLREGDIVVAVGGTTVGELATFYRTVWARGQAGVEVPLTLNREGDVFDVRLTSADRQRYLRGAQLH